MSAREEAGLGVRLGRVIDEAGWMSQAEAHEQDLTGCFRDVDPEAQLVGQKGDGVTSRQRVCVRSKLQADPSLQNHGKFLGAMRDRMSSTTAAGRKSDQKWFKPALRTGPAQRCDLRV